MSLGDADRICVTTFAADGTATTSSEYVVRLGEEPVAGTAAKLPRFVWAPMLHLRNEETLRRLAFLSEGRRREREAGEHSARTTVPDPAEGTPDAEAAADVAAASCVACRCGGPGSKVAPGGNSSPGGLRSSAWVNALGSGAPSRRRKPCRR